MTIKQITEFMEYLKNPGTDDLSLEKFDRKLQEIFPEAYGKEGNDSLANMNTDNVALQGEQNFGEQNDIGSADAAVGDILGGGGSFGGDFMNDGSTESMMNQVNPSAFAGESDSFMDELNSPEDKSGDLKVGGTAVSDEENVANSLTGI